MDISDICSICKKSSDQMLMLSCVHDPCINCAANSYAEQVHIRGQSNQLYVCQICTQQTPLDSSTISELSNLSRSYVKVPSIKVTTHSTISNNNQLSRNKNVAISASPNSKKKDVPPTVNKKTTYFCKQHSEEQISYYCFSCHMNICPECAIHGKHKDHDVKLIKKALAEVKGDYLEIINQISISQTAMSKYKDSFLKLIKQSNQKSNRDKSIVTRQFQIIRSNLAVKQKQLLKSIEEANKRNIQVLTNFLETINVHYEDANKAKKSIELILRKDQVLIFEEYKNISDIEEKVKETKRKSDQISGQQNFLNTEFIQQQIKIINQNISKIKEVLKVQQVRSPISIQSRAVQKQ